MFVQTPAVYLNSARSTITKQTTFLLIHHIAALNTRALKYVSTQRPLKGRQGEILIE